MTSPFIFNSPMPAPFAKRQAVVLAAMAVAAMTAPLAHAQQGAPTKEGAVKLAEGVVMYPSVKLSMGHDDNVRAVNTGAISSSVTVLAPQLKVEAQNKSGLYTLSYNGAYTSYNSLSTDNTNNHNLGATGAHEFSAPPRVRIVVASIDQPRGRR